MRRVSQLEDPLTRWFDWAGEYYTLYPDGMAVPEQPSHEYFQLGI